MADGIQGVPAGVTGTPVQGVPPGVTGTPVAPPSGAAIQGVPQGVTGTPIQSTWDSIKQDIGDTFSNAEQGADTSFAQVPATLGHVIQNIPGVGPLLSKYTDLDPTTARYAAQAAKPIQGAAGYGGALLETMAEWMTGEGELKALSQGDRMVKIGQNVKLLERFPKLAEAIAAHPDMARILGTGGQQAAMAGTQTLAHGGTPEQALTSAGTAGVIGSGLDWAGNALNDLRPGVTPIEGADFPTRADGTLNMPPLSEVQADPVTGKVDEAFGNMAQRAVARSLNRTIDARAAIQDAAPAAITDASRMLPAPADSTPGFTVGPAAEPTPVREGQMVYDPGKQQIATRAVGGKGPGTFDLPSYSPELADAADEAAAKAGTLGATQPQPEPVGSHREPVFQYRNQVRPGTMNPVSETAAGPGQMILTSDGQASSVARARAQQGQYERIMGDSNIWNEIGVRQQQAIQDAHADISDQLNRFDDHQASQPHFAPPNVADAVANTSSLADASKQLKDQHGVFWNTADDLSGGRFTELRNQEKALQNALRSEGRTGDRAVLSQQLMDNQDAQENLFNQYRTQLSPQEWDYHRAGYQDGIVLGNYDSLIQSHFNGITRADVADAAAQGQNLQRVFDPSDGFNNQIENFLNKGTNRAVLERTIGRDGILNTKQIGQLFDNSTRQVASKGLLDNISSAIRRHHYGLGGIVGGGLAYGVTHSIGAALGIGGGAAAAGTATGTMRYITERLASDPAFLNRFMFAVKQGIPPRVAGAVLAATLMPRNTTTAPTPPPPGGP